MKRYNDFLNENDTEAALSYGIKDSMLIQNIESDVAPFLVKFMDKVEPEIKKITDKFGLKLTKNTTLQMFSIEMLNDDFEIFVTLEDFDIVLTDDAGTVYKSFDSLANRQTMSITRDLFNVIYNSTLDAQYIEDSYIDGMINNDITNFNNFRKFVQDHFDNNFENLISPEIKEKYAYIFKNELF